MALPRPQEGRWRYGSAAAALLVLQTLVPCCCCPPRHATRIPLLRQEYLALDCPTQKFPPSAAALKKMDGRFTRRWRGLAYSSSSPSSFPCRSPGMKTRKNPAMPELGCSGIWGQLALLYVGGVLIQQRFSDTSSEPKPINQVAVSSLFSLFSPIFSLSEKSPTTAP